MKVINELKIGLMLKDARPGQIAVKQVEKNTIHILRITPHQDIFGVGLEDGYCYVAITKVQEILSDVELVIRAKEV